MTVRSPGGPVRAACPEEVRSVLLVLTSQCNLRCSYCFQNAKRPGTMSWDVVRRSLDLALRSRHGEVEVTFFGGEPLIVFATIRRAVAYVEERRPRGKRIRYSLSTNGLLLSEEILGFLGRHSFQIQLSFDGVPAAQALRGRGTFEILDRWLDRLREPAWEAAAERLRVTLTLVPRNVDRLAESIEYFFEKRVREIAINPSITAEPGWAPGRIVELEAQFDRIVERSVVEWTRTGEVPLLVFRGGRTRRFLRRRSIAMCGVARGEEPAVDIDGQVHGCAMFTDSTQRFRTSVLARGADAMRIGDLRAPDFRRRFAAFPQAAARAGIFSEKGRKRSSYARCGECPYLVACSVCPVAIANVPGNEDPDRIPDFSCGYNLAALRHRDLFWARVTPLMEREASEPRERARVPSSR